MLKTKHKHIPVSKNIFTFPSRTRNTKTVLIKLMYMGTGSVASKFLGLYIRLVLLGKNGNFNTTSRRIIQGIRIADKCERGLLSLESIG